MALSDKIYSNKIEKNCFRKDKFTISSEEEAYKIFTKSSSRRAITITELIIIISIVCNIYVFVTYKGEFGYLSYIQLAVLTLNISLFLVNFLFKEVPAKAFYFVKYSINKCAFLATYYILMFYESTLDNALKGMLPKIAFGYYSSHIIISNIELAFQTQSPNWLIFFNFILSTILPVSKDIYVAITSQKVIIVCIFEYLLFFCGIAFMFIIRSIQEKNYENFISYRRGQNLNMYYLSLINNLRSWILTYYNGIDCIYNSKPDFSLCCVGRITSNEQLFNQLLLVKENEFDRMSLSEAFRLYLISVKEIKQTSTLTHIGLFGLPDRSLFANASAIYFQIDESQFLVNIVIDDVTEVVKSKLLIDEAKLSKALVSKIVHEFKTPLIALNNSVSELTNCNEIKEILSESEDLKRKAINITYLCDYIQFLINDIIISASNSDINTHMEEIDLAEILDFSEGVLISLLASVTRDKNNNVKPKISYDKELSTVRVISDKTRLKQVILNLISNSVKFTRKGIIEISVKYCEFSNNVLISVKDTGIGMSDEYLSELTKDEKLSEFTVTNSNYLCNKMGTGIGINVTKSILKKLGHEFRICSSINKGTEVNIIISNSSRFEKKVSFKLLQYDDSKQIEGSKKQVKHTDLMKDDKRKSSFKMLNQDIAKINSFSIQHYSPSKNRSLNNSEATIPNKYINMTINLELSKSEKVYFHSNTPEDSMQTPKSKFQILLVEDVFSIRKASCSILNSHSYFMKFDVVECSDGCDITSMVLKDQIAENIKIIITDENMEFINGSSAIKMLKKLQKEKMIQIPFLVIVTGECSEELFKYFISIGANLIVNKPLCNENLERIKIAYNKYSNGE